MLTVIVGFERSGKRRMRRPLLCIRYSVMPSTDVTFSTCAYADAADSSTQRNRVRKQARFMETSEFGYYSEEMIVQGFKTAAVAAGIKPGGVLDLALILSDRPATA